MIQTIRYNNEYDTKVEIVYCNIMQWIESNTRENYNYCEIRNVKQTTAETL